MKTNVTYVDSAKFEAIIKNSGLPYNVQSCVKVIGPKGHNVYVCAGKNVTGRVDISGFEMDGPGYVEPHCGRFGNVRQQLDFSLSEDAILENFAALLEHMKTLEPKAKPERKAPAPKKDAPVGLSPEFRAKRLEALKAKGAKLDGHNA
jgi:hypothetical protein